MLKTLFYDFVKYIQELWSQPRYKDDIVDCVFGKTLAFIIAATFLNICAVVCVIVVFLICHPTVMLWIVLPLLLPYLVIYVISKIKLPDEENTNGNDNIE